MLYLPTSRRSLLRALGLSAIGGSTISIQACSSDPGMTELNLFVSNDREMLTFILPRSEMGQDVVTSFAMLIAEELDAPLSMIAVKIADASPSIPNQMTVASSSVSSWWHHMRQIGANTRQLLINLAAVESGKAPSELYTEEGRIKSADGQTDLPYRVLLQKLEIPQTVANTPLKSPAAFKLIGTNQASVFNREKATGNFNYLADLSSDSGSLTVVSTAFKEGEPLPNQERLASLKRKFNLQHAFSVTGTIGRFNHFVFLCHKKTWPLIKAKKEIESERHLALQGANKIKASRFDEQSTEKQTRNLVNADEITLTYETPAIPHLCMETPNARIKFSSNQVEIWAPTQAPDQAHQAMARQLGVDQQKITLHSIPMGGGFGRKRYTDYLEELVLAAQHFPEKQSELDLTLFWTREDDLNRELYRPATLQTVTWRASNEKALAIHVVEGAAGLESGDIIPISTDLPLGFDQQASLSFMPHHFSSGIWRSVHHGYHAFALCSTVDELCAQSSQDPIGFYIENAPAPSAKERVKTLISDYTSGAERITKVIEQVKQMSGWQDNRVNNSGLGFATYKVFGSSIALVAKVSITGDEKLVVEKVWAAVDCGLAINPDKLKAQIEGGIIYGLSACLYSDEPKNKDTLALNFDSMPVMRMQEVPAIDVHIMENQLAPSGAGELGVPPIAPAITNAIRTLRPYRWTKLPILKGQSINYDNAFKVSVT